MTVPSFDTLDISKRLRSVGFNDDQAEMVTNILRDVRAADLSQLATKADIAGLEAVMKADIARLEAKMDAQEAKIEAQLEILRRDLTIRLGGMIVVATGILLAAKFFG